MTKIIVDGAEMDVAPEYTLVETRYGELVHKMGFLRDIRSGGMGGSVAGAVVVLLGRRWRCTWNRRPQPAVNLPSLVGGVLGSAVGLAAAAGACALALAAPGVS
jgi:hypothetical protein